MDRRNRRVRRNRRRLVAAVLFHAAVVLGAADTAVIGFEPDRVVRGQRFTIQIRTSIPWSDEISIVRPELTGTMVWWAFPYARPWSPSDTGDPSVRLVEVLASVRVDQSGFHLIGPFRISSGDRVAVTDPGEIIALEPDEAELPYPVTIGWRNIPVSFWQSQAVPLVLEARNLVSLALADASVLASAPAGLLEKASALGGIQTRPHGNDILYDVPMAAWIWTVGDPGKQTFPAARITVAGLVRATPSFTVDVVPLPEQVLASSAVGNFTLTNEWEEGPHRVGDIVSIRVRADGEGNLNVLKLPQPSVRGAVPVSQGSTSSYVPSVGGYLGWREDRFDFQIETAGDLPVTIPEWTWLDPSGGGRVRTRPAGVSTLVAVPADGSSDRNHADLLLGGEAFHLSRSVFHWRNEYLLLLGLPGFITLAVLFLIRRPNRTGAIVAAIVAMPLFFAAAAAVPEAVADAATAAARAREGDWDTAADLYRELLENHGEVPGLLHDLAIVELETDRADLAVALIRRAMVLRPGSQKLSDTRDHIEERLGLSDQVPVSLNIPVWIVHMIWLILLNLFFLAVAGLLYRRTARRVILLLSVFLLLVSSSGFLLFVEHRWSRPTAVVRAVSSPLKKIPGPLATDWIQLPAGTAVLIRAVEGDDRLVLTGYGLEGWLPSSSLIPITSTFDEL